MSSPSSRNKRRHRSRKQYRLHDRGVSNALLILKQPNISRYHNIIINLTLIGRIFDTKDIQMNLMLSTPNIKLDKDSHALSMSR